jgi:hypothetical protein
MERADSTTAWTRCWFRDQGSPKTTFWVAACAGAVVEVLGVGVGAAVVDGAGVGTGSASPGREQPARMRHAATADPMIRVT